MLQPRDEEVAAAIGSVASPPYRSERLFLDCFLNRQFDELAGVRGAIPGLEFGYSVKTNPSPAILDAASGHAFWAETIGPEELQAAAQAGFEHTIYNGPIPAYMSPRAPSIAFADSYEAFARNAVELSDTLCGIRLRPSYVRSRFGVAHDDPVLHERVAASGRTATAVSFHVRPEDFGTHSLRDIVLTVLEAAVRLERSGMAVEAFDVGGGWTPDAFDRAFESGDFAWAVSTVMGRLRSCRRVFAEPGQAVVTPLECMVAPVLEVRRGAIVVNAGYPDVPQMHGSKHRLFLARAPGAVAKLQSGSTRIMGRTCLEYDEFPDGVSLPADIGLNDAVVIADCGAYDASMSFTFARAGEQTSVI